MTLDLSIDVLRRIASMVKMSTQVLESNTYSPCDSAICICLFYLVCSDEVQQCVQ